MLKRLSQVIGIRQARLSILAALDQAGGCGAEKNTFNRPWVRSLIEGLHGCRPRKHLSLKSDWLPGRVVECATFYGPGFQVPRVFNMSLQPLEPSDVWALYTTFIRSHREDYWVFKTEVDWKVLQNHLSEIYYRGLYDGYDEDVDILKRGIQLLTILKNLGENASVEEAWVGQDALPKPLPQTEAVFTERLRNLLSNSGRKAQIWRQTNHLARCGVTELFELAVVSETPSVQHLLQLVKDVLDVHNSRLWLFVLAP